VERGWIPPVERKRKEDGKTEREKKRHLNKTALELKERSEHKSLTHKKTHCV